MHKGKVMMSQNKTNRIGCPRVGENKQQVKSRKQRLYAIGADWYFNTREGIEIGPFESRKEAENGINSFIRQVGFNMIRGDAPLP